MPTGKRFASVQIGAQYSGLSEKTLRRYIADGRLTGYRLGARLLRIDLNELDALFKVIPTARAVERMPPDKVRPPGGQPRGAEEKAPAGGLSAATPPSTTKTAQQRLLAQIEELLGGPPRCCDCRRPIHIFRSVLAGRGPVCRRKHG